MSSADGYQNNFSYLS